MSWPLFLILVREGCLSLNNRQGKGRSCQEIIVKILDSVNFEVGTCVGKSAGRGLKGRKWRTADFLHGLSVTASFEDWVHDWF